MSIGLDNASINLVYANSSQNLTNNINIDEEGLKRNDSNINNIPGTGIFNFLILFIKYNLSRKRK